MGLTYVKKKMCKRKSPHWKEIVSPDTEGSKELNDCLGRSQMEAASAGHQAWLPPRGWEKG